MGELVLVAPTRPALLLHPEFEQMSHGVDDIDFAEKLDFFRRADHCFGHSAFMMSGSGSLFYFHIGVVRALLDQGLLPNVLSGSSGGAFVGALLSTHSTTELAELLERLGDLLQ